MLEIGKAYKTKYGDGSIFRVLKKRNNGQSAIYGFIITSPHSLYEISKDRISNIEISEIEVKEHLLDVKITNFKLMLNNQLRMLEGLKWEDPQSKYYI